jgi:hypothetical protein
MTLEEIKQALEEGKRVFVGGANCEVIKDSIGQYLIKSGDHYIGLTWRDGVTPNYDPETIIIR